MTCISGITRIDDNMDDKEKQKKLESFSITADERNFAIAKRIVINIPFDKFCEDKENGTALLLGKMEEAKAVLINLMKQRMIAKRPMLFKPNGPIKPTVA